MPCDGDSTQACGGPNRISVYWSGQEPPPAAVTNPGPGNWTSVGCYEDSAERTLPQQVATLGGGPEMSVQTCTDACFQEGFMYAGIEYSSECWCGNWINGKPASDGRCNMLCNGNSGEYCGGSYGLNIYGYGLPKLPVECPRWDQYNETLADGSIVFYECGIDHAGFDLTMTYEQSYESCATTCTKTFGCQAFSWRPPQGGPCYMKSSVGASNMDSGVWGGRVINSNAKAPSTSSAAPSATVSAGPRPVPTGPLACPEWDQANFTTSDGAVFLSECFKDHIGADLSMSYVDTYGECAESCSSATGCRAFSWVPPAPGGKGGPCYLKSSVGAAYDHAGVWGGKLLALAPPKPSSSVVSVSIASSSSAFHESSASSEVISAAPSSSHAVESSSSSEEASASWEASSSISTSPSASISSEMPSSSAEALSSSVFSSIEASSSSSILEPSSSAPAPSSSAVESSSSMAEMSSSTIESSSSVADISSSSAAPSASSSEVSSSMAESSSSSAESASATSSAEISSSSSVEPSSSAAFESSSSALSTSMPESSSSSVESASASVSSSAEISSSSEVPSSISSFVPTSSSATSSAPASSSSVPPHWYYVGCYTDSTAKRALTYPAPLPNGNSNDNCQVACKAAGYLLAGQEYGAECYCGNNIMNGNGPAPDGEVGCNMPCAANNTQTCGGSNRLSLWAWSTWSPPSTTTSSVSMSSVSVSALPKPTIPANWTYAGCYHDNYAGYGRVMKNEQPDDNTLTQASCISTCNDMGYSVAGMEYGVQCFCDDFLRNGAPQATDTDCNMACAGDDTAMCGAGDRLTVWSKGNLTVLPVPTIPKNNIPQNWTYVGCVFDSVTAARPLPYKDTSTNNTVENCINQCKKFGYPAAGVEYGEECYCGDYSDVWATGPELRPDGECNMPCSGNASELCGTGGRLQTYFWNSTEPLNDWHYAEGAEAGEYKYMMGSLVIPLMATLGINDKVSFLEKWGTGPPNSTGAYEYDYRDPDYRTAWRTQHVKTDVFCAASLIMPDRAGRQLNVGGWSTDALSGIRLHTPDGNPGNESFTDWQENHEVLKLQNGRWYPTAMVMADGQIIVVGGQDGSNGPPVPTLETLPPRGPPLFCEWLRASDPWNLYPFMAVQRDGIFIQYWNEARILDENTFETVRMLKPVPGAVNAPKGGRTYPLEGTMVLLPQYAPYTDSLETLICGGSTVDNVALDNCVTTKTEDPDADWIIERMPSKRVMTNMAALPDGTYLMVGGAQRGVAGFALADLPNLNALLYDPRKPIGSRMTVMANTTIERMYHSEAILLNDGRVMISGSDPQDTRFPQQYIIEQFLPPYLLNGKPFPSFELQNRDWNYGESITVEGIVAPNAGIGGVTFSMLGAVSSTHSSSMGQRTIFPAVSCSGTTCTITAPPDAHIAPPGWFQLFALDDGQPSQGMWIRLGKDPGEMGNWPAGLEDFAPLPGLGDYVPWY